MKCRKRDLYWEVFQAILIDSLFDFPDLLEIVFANWIQKDELCLG